MQASPTVADSGPWTLGTLIWMPVALLLIATAIYGWLWLRREAIAQTGKSYGWATEARVGAIACLVAAALVVAGTAWGMYPYKAEYHQWRDVSGTVEKIDKRLIGNGSGMEDKFVVRFDGSSLQFGCDDTRCAQVEPGDALKLSCKRAWQYTGTDGYDCRFVSNEVAA